MKWSLPFFCYGIAVHAFTKVTPEQAWPQLTPGWNLGNTLDATPTEGSWNNAPVTNQTFQEIKASGFKSVRIPITWANHFATQAPDYTVDATWMSRVETVVDMALANDFWVVINAHHDSTSWADFSTGGDLSAKYTQFEKLWTQVATRLSMKSEKLIMESLNEPAGSTADVAAIYNDLNSRFYTIVRNSGGYNMDRILSLPAMATNTVYAAQWFKAPANASLWTLQVHYYTPWDFVSNSWGRTFWGSDSDLATMKTDLAYTYGNFTNVKILIGEFSTSGPGVIVEKAAAWLWFDYFCRTAKQYGMAIQMWDNGNDYYDRVNHVWRDPTTKNIVLAASAGTVNTLPANGNATVWLKQGQTVTDQTISLLTNGNTVTGVSTTAGSALPSTAFTISGSTVSLKASYLSSLPTSTLGVIGTVVIKSSQGVDLPIDIKRYAVPTVTTTKFASPPVASDLSIPVTLNGAQLATMKAYKADGTILKDDWTQYLGPLQQGRMNWGGDYDYSGGNLIVKASLLSTIQSSGQAVTITWEFWPRTDQSNNIPMVISYV